MTHVFLLSLTGSYPSTVQVFIPLTDQHSQIAAWFVFLHPYLSSSNYSSHYNRVAWKVLQKQALSYISSFILCPAPEPPPSGPFPIPPETWHACVHFHTAAHDFPPARSSVSPANPSHSSLNTWLKYSLSFSLPSRIPHPYPCTVRHSCCSLCSLSFNVLSSQHISYYMTIICMFVFLSTHVLCPFV